MCRVQNQIKSHYLAANANSGFLTASLIKFDKKKAAVAVQWRHFKCAPPFSWQTNQKRVAALYILPENGFPCQPTDSGPVNFGALHQLTSGLQGSSQNCPIVGPTGGWPGCLWSPGGRFYKHRRRGEFELQRWQKSSGLDGGHSRVTQ